MAITVNPLTDVIYVPKADLTLIQASPEVRELDLDWFRLELRDWEDSEEAMPRPKTHNHVTETTLAGLTYARIVEILSPYTVEFEDAQYTVNCVGANHNISDVKVANQVSLIINNAAGLITNAAIEYSSYGNKVSLDPNSANTGTLFPIGTPQAPVNNLDDALLIASVRGFIEIELYDDLTISSTEDISGLTIRGRTSDVVLTIATSVIANNANIENLTLLDSVLDGGLTVRNCVVDNVSYLNGFIHNCGLTNTLTLGGSTKCVVTDCYTVDQDYPPTINMGGSGNDLAMPNYSGIVTFTNLSGASNEIGLGMDAGYCILDSTITAGTIIISGVGLLMDGSGAGANVNTDGMINSAAISSAVWDEPIGNHLISGTTGRSVGIQQFAGAVHVDPTSGISGTAFPNGTERSPVDNMTDALAIAVANGISTFNFHYNTTVTGGTYQGYTFVGRGRHSPTLTISNAVMLYCQFREIKITGTFGDNSIIGTYFCAVEDASNISIQAYETVFYGTIGLTNGLGTNESNFYTCTDGVPGIGIPDIQLNTCASLGIWNWNGGIRLSNISTVDTEITCMIAQGRLWVDDTCVEGDIIVKGLADLRGTTGGTTIDSEGLITKDTISEATWDATAHHVHFDASTANTGTEYPMGTAQYPLNNLADVVTIATAHGKRGIWFTGTLVIDQDLVGFNVKGETSVLNDVAVVAGVDVSNTVFDLCTLTGTAVGSSNIQALNGIVSNFNGFDGVIINGGCKDTVQVKSGGTMIGKSIAFAGASDIVDANGAVFVGLDFNGVFTLQNLTGGGYFQAGGSFGQVTLDASVNGGVGRIYGTLEVVDNSTSMTWLDDGTISRESIDTAVWTGANGLAVQSDLSFIQKIEGGRWVISGGQMIFYDDDNVTEVARFNLTYDANQNPTERTRV
jgi:hypothetical protein